MITNGYIWYEVFLHRPYEMETLHNILINIATLSSRGAIIWEVRCKNSKLRYLLGLQAKSISKVQEVFKAHGEVQFSEATDRVPVHSARKSVFPNLYCP